MSKISEENELLKAREKAAAFNQKKAYAASGVGSISRELNIYQKFFRQVGTVAVWLWWNFGNPVLNKFTVPLIRRLLGWDIWIWNRVAFSKDEFGIKRLSYVKGAAFIMVHLALFFMIVSGFMYDSIVYPFTYESNRTVWLSSAQEIYPGSNVFSVQGCDHLVAKVCNEDESLYYRVRPTIFNNMWSILHWRGPFFADKVVATIGSDWSKCIVSDYGLRWRFLIFWEDIYPDLLVTSCERSAA